MLLLHIPHELIQAADPHDLPVDDESDPMTEPLCLLDMAIETEVSID